MLCLTYLTIFILFPIDFTTNSSSTLYIDRGHKLMMPAMFYNHRYYR